MTTSSGNCHSFPAPQGSVSLLSRCPLSCQPLFQMFGLNFAVPIQGSIWLFEFILAGSWSLYCIILKICCVLKNPRRSPTHEMNPRGSQEGHIYVKTVSGSEEPLPDTYRPPEELERRRGLWWLVPSLSLE